MPNASPTSSAISLACDLCGGTRGTLAYTAQASRRALAVAACDACGLVQSVPVGEASTERRQTLSADADWGNVRHGKGARLAAATAILERAVPLAGMRNALDIGSNRGDFVRWLRGRHPDIRVTAIEPDLSVVDSYRHLEGIDFLPGRLEDVALPASHFDLVYSAHTLEHAASARRMMEITHACMKPGGWCFLEVPNIDAIGHADIVEEFFIDKHTFHFDRLSLARLVEATGFDIAHGRDDRDHLNISLVLRRSERGPSPAPSDRALAQRNVDLIARYRETLERNRALLRRVVSEKLAPLAGRQKVAYWGAGRIFDALVKYGGLQPAHVYRLVDRHLAGLMSDAHGVRIDKPEALKAAEPHVVVVLARSSEAEIARSAHRFGVRHVVTFTDLLAQCR